MRSAAGILALAALTLVVACDSGPKAPSTTTGSPAIRLEVPASPPEALAPGTYITTNFQPPASFRLGDGWSAAVVDTAAIALVRETPDSDCLCIVRPDGVFDPVGAGPAELPADLTVWLQEHPGLETTNPSSVQVGNRAARQMEARVAAGATLINGRLPLFTAGDQDYAMSPGDRGHIIVIDHPTGPVVVAVRAPADSFGDYFRAVETMVGSLGFSD